MHSTSHKAAPAPFPSLQALIGNEDQIHEEQIAPQFHMMHFRKVENSGNFQTSDNHITLFHEHGFVNLLQVHDREVERHVRKYEGRTVRNCFFVKPTCAFPQLPQLGLHPPCQQPLPPVSPLTAPKPWQALSHDMPWLLKIHGRLCLVHHTCYSLLSLCPGPLKLPCSILHASLDAWKPAWNMNRLSNFSVALIVLRFQQLREHHQQVCRRRGR